MALKLGAGSGIVAVISIFFVCCFHQTAHCEDDQIHWKVGVSLPLTGAGAEYGSACRNGIELAKVEKPELFSTIRFVYEDDEYLASRAVTAFTKLRDKDQVDLAIVFGEPSVQAVSPLARSVKLPLLAVINNPSALAPGDYSVQTLNPSRHYSQVLLQYLRSRGAKRIAVVKTEDPWINGFLDTLSELKKSDEELLTAASLTADSSDLRTIIAKLKTGGFDAIGVYLFPGQASLFFRQAREAKLKSLFFGTDVLDSTTEIADADGSMEGAVYSAMVIPEEFRARYIQLYGNDLQLSYAYNLYNVAMLLGRVVADSPRVGPASFLISALKEKAAEEQEAFSYRSDAQDGNYLEFRLAVKQIRDGKPAAIIQD